LLLFKIASPPSFLTMNSALGKHDWGNINDDILFAIQKSRKIDDQG
jgi:hypothetical protein